MKNVLFKALMVVVFGSLLVFSAGCEDDNYYEKPSWVGEPIYQMLEAEGDFSHYLACVDKTGYAKVLKASGFYTAFVPNDAAFEVFMEEHGIGSVEEISEELADDIVSYSLTSVASTEQSIDDFQRNVAYEDRETNLNIAFKRRTYKSKGVYTFTAQDGSSVEVVDVNQASEIPGQGVVYFGLENKNAKNIPFFTDAFLQTKGLSVEDYNFFYPDAEFSGFNVADARVVTSDLRAENGMVHVVDKVLLPLDNLEELLEDAEESSDFYDILKKYMVYLTPAPRDFLLREERNTGVYKDIYIKSYPYLHFPLNNENHLSVDGAQGSQIDTWTLFAPTNEALQSYFSETFLAKGYQSLEEMPLFVIEELVNAHLFRNAVWPSRFATTQNYFGEPARFDKDVDVVGAQMASNGFYYTVSKVQETNAFSTVMRDVLLDPRYTMFYRALVATENQYQLRNPISRQQVYLISNEQFNELGLTYSATDNTWTHEIPEWQDLAITSVLDRLLNLHMIFLPNADDPFEDLSTGYGLVETNNGELIRYFRGRIWASGQTLLTGATLNVESGKDTLVNGITYELNKPLLFSTQGIGAFLESNASYRGFFRYIEKSANSTAAGAEDPNEKSRLVYDPDTKRFADISIADPQTYLIPNNTAIDAAVAAGLLPQITAADFTQAEQEMVKRFVQFHTLRRQYIYPNNGYNNIAYTNFKDNDGDTYVSVDSNTTDQLKIYDRKGREAVATFTGTSPHTCVLANGAIIHLIDNYLDYRAELVEE